MIFRTVLVSWLTAILIGLAVPVSGAIPPSAANQAASVYKLRVNGLACPYCAYGIEKLFHKTGKVERSDIDLQNGLVLLYMKPGQSFSREQLKRLVNDAGFSLDGVEIENRAPGGSGQR